ncbi:MAG: S8 family serine peptidase [Chloroflexota bacterium]
MTLQLLPEGTTRVSRGRPFPALLAGILALALLLPAVQAGQLAGALISVIVREAPGSGSLPEQLVESSGGTVTRELPIIGGFAAELPRGALARVAADPAVVSITPNAPLQMQGSNYSPGSDVGSMHSTMRLIGANSFWSSGFTGSGVDVAIIDSGVSPVLGLSEAGKVIRGPDLSFESQAANLRFLDTFGHGTFMAGLIAGHDPGAQANLGQAVTGYSGVAPGARIVSVKVADAHGATDVSQVIAAIDWVVQHRRDNGMNIRVLNLSFGTYGAQPYTLDPLAFAAEVAWHSGLFVVVAAGNNAPASGRLMNPAMDPFVMAVGAASPNGTVPTRDDVLMASSARGDGVRNPDLVAPGRSLQGLRVPGSYIDQTFPAGRISDRFFRGSGTSQAAAIVSGAAALVIQQRPAITPDQLKALLTSTADALPAADVRGQGAGMLNLGDAFRAPTTLSVQAFARSTGTGSLELARGGNHLVLDGVVLEGEQDIFGAAFDSATMAAQTLAGTSWTGGTWNGSVWAGPGWAGNEWSTIEWESATWSGNEWSGNEWSANEWSGSEWSASEWSASEWSASEWSASEWSASEWSSEGWQTMEWSSSR